MNAKLKAAKAIGGLLLSPDWARELGEWRELLGRCGKKASRKRVHELRVATLRLQAELNCWQSNRAEQDFGSKAVRRWGKQADRLRKVLSPVRDADVYLQMLEELAATRETVPQDNPGLSEKCQHEIGVLHKKLERKREVAVIKLTAALQARGEKFDRAGQAVEKLFADGRVPAAVETTSAIRRSLNELSWDAPMLNAATLHDFRKKAKTARYLAEISQDAASKNQVRLLKRMQAAAGAWHDWQTLCGRAKAKLGEKDPDGLTRWLETKAEYMLAAALGECRRTMLELEGSVQSPSGAVLKKKPATAHRAASDGLRLA